MLELLKLIWRKWKGVAHGLVHAQSWVLMAIAYWSAVFPVSVYFRLFRSDPTDRGLGEEGALTHGKVLELERQDILRA
ncbi:MAG: hypothetical protein QGG40_14580, partial [Myxococcota bacterium]|nr:hypothetical protein [Myxococcota bacterium]